MNAYESDSAGPFMWQTYADINRRASAFADGLLAAGCQIKQYIGIWSANCTEWVTTEQHMLAKAFLLMITLSDHSIGGLPCKPFHIYIMLAFVWKLAWTLAS